MLNSGYMKSGWLAKIISVFLFFCVSVLCQMGISSNFSFAAGSESLDFSKGGYGNSNTDIEKKKLTLDECVEIAVSNSKEIEVSLDKIDLSKIKRIVSFRDLFPTLSVFWKKTSGDDSESGDYMGREYGLEAEHEMWPREYIKYSYLQTKKDLKFNEVNSKQVSEKLVYEVKKAFYELAKAKNDLKNYMEILGESKILFDLAEKENASGLISQLEYLKVASTVKDIESQKKTKEYVIKLARVKLYNVLKIDAPILVDIKEDVEFNTEAPFFLLEADKEEEAALRNYVDLALANRLEAEMDRNKVEFYNYGKKAVEGKGKPKISLVGSFKKVGDDSDPYDMGNMIIKYKEEWFVGTKVSFPWCGSVLDYSYDTGVSVPNRTSAFSTANESDTINQSLKLSVLGNLKYYSDRKEALVAYQIALSEQREQAGKIILEVSEAFYNHENAANKAWSSFEKIKYVQKEKEVVESMRQLGEETLSKSVESLTALQEAKDLYNQAVFEYYLSVLDLNKAVGRQEIVMQ